MFDEKMSNKSDEQLEDLLGEVMERYNKLSNLNYKHPSLDVITQQILYIKEEMETRQFLKDNQSGTVFESDKKYNI